MLKNPMFRGCTRPPMFMGVPYVPFFLGTGTCMLLTVYFNMFYLLLIPPVIFTMRLMAKRDEMVFRLLGLRLQFRVRMRNMDIHKGMWVLTPNIYRGQSKDNH
jgi:type IV secretion system protein VirB3